MPCRAPARTSTSSSTRVSSPTAPSPARCTCRASTSIDGEPLDPPAELPLVVFPVSVEGDDIVLELPEGEVPINE